MRRAGRNAVRGTVRLGRELELIMRGVKPRQAGLGRLRDRWEVIVGCRLAGHSRPSELSAGQLKIVADSPSHLYELRLSRDRILRQLRRTCPGLRIGRVRFSIA
jgi:predicted nucleic acid-binding Zn ribbon protein